MSASDRVGKGIAPIAAGYVLSAYIDQIDKIFPYLLYQLFRKYIQRIQSLRCQLF